MSKIPIRIWQPIKERRNGWNWSSKCKKRLKLQYPDAHDLNIESDNHIFRITLTLTLSDSYEL